MFVGVTAVGQSQRQQIVGQRDAERVEQWLPRQVLSVDGGHGVSPGWSGNISVSFAQRGSMMS